MMCTIGPRRFVPFLQAFRERHPKVRLIVQDGSSTRAAGAAGAGRARRRGLRPARGDRRALPRAPPLRRALRDRRRAGPRLRQAERGARAAICDDQAYVNRLQCEFFGHAGRIFREQGAKPRIVFRSDRDDWVQSMALAGLGFTFIPEYAVTMPGLRVRPLIDPEIVRTIQVVTVRGRPHVPTVGAFVREVLAFPWINAGASAPTAAPGRPSPSELSNQFATRHFSRDASRLRCCVIAATAPVAAQPHGDTHVRSHASCFDARSPPASPSRPPPSPANARPTRCAPMPPSRRRCGPRP